MDILGVTQLVGGVLQPVAAALEGYFYTDQEKAHDALAGRQLTAYEQQVQAQNNATSAQATAQQDREATTRMGITYGLAGVAVIGLAALGLRLVD